MARPSKPVSLAADGFVPFGTALRMLRTEAGVGLRALARDVGVSSAYLSRIENGRDAPPTPERLAAIAEALAVPPDTLVDLAGRTGAALDDYIARVPSAGALFLDIARRDLDADKIARLAEFVARELTRPRAATAAVPGLAELIAPARIRLRVAGNSLESLIDVGAALCAKALPGIGAADLAARLRAREAQTSTALGNGLAVPHVVMEGATATAALVTPARALAVATPDGAPLRAAIIVVAGSRDAHLQTLAMLARLAARGAAADLARARTARAAHAILDRHA